MAWHIAHFDGKNHKRSKLTANINSFPLIFRIPLQLACLTVEAYCQQQQQQNICNKYRLMKLHRQFVPQKMAAKSNADD